MVTKKKIAVVGAGISGLICAYELQKKGFEVIVYEKENQVGGRMSSRSKNGLTFDIGANHLCGLYGSMQTYCKEFGITWKKMHFDVYRIYRNKKIIKSYQAVGLLTRLRLAIEFFRTRKQPKIDFFDLSSTVEYDNNNAYDHLKKRLGKEGADYFADPFSTTYQFHGAREISLGVVAGVMQLLKFRNSGWNLHQTVGGMIALPQALTRHLNVKLSTPVNQVVGGKEVTITTDKQEKFDAVILASTADCTKKIYSNPSDEEQQLLSSARYASTISLAFVVDVKKIPDISVVWVPRVESSTISGFTNEKMKGEGFMTAQQSLLCVWLHEDYAKSIIGLSDTAIFDEVKKELLKFCPWFSNENELLSHDIQRWNCAMPKFYPGYLTQVKTFLEQEKNENNIFLCGDYLNSIWTEGALRCGQRTAEKVNQALSTANN